MSMDSLDLVETALQDLGMVTALLRLCNGFLFAVGALLSFQQNRMMAGNPHDGIEQTDLC